MGLPCAHICDERRGTIGLVPTDFHPHWYWDRINPKLPYLDPRHVRQNLQARTAKNTSRQLSSFEYQSPRSLPICSACRQTGHIRTSRNCPERLQASIAESNRLLRENELSQASQASPLLPVPITLSISVTVPSTAPAVLSTAQYMAPLPFTGLTGLTACSPSVATPVSAFVNPQETIRTYNSLSSSPDRVFQQPISMEPGIIPDSQAPTPDHSPLRIYHRSISPPAPPLKPLGPNRPEMIYIRYIAEKVDWLAKNPYVRPNNYRKARGWPIWNRKTVESHRHHLPLERRKPSGEIISEHADWTIEEITAFLDNDDQEEDQLAEEMLAEMMAGRVIQDKRSWIEEVNIREKEQEKLFTL